LITGLRYDPQHYNCAMSGTLLHSTRSFYGRPRSETFANAASQSKDYFMMKLLATVAVAALALSSPVFAQNSTQMVSGPGVTCPTPSTASTSTDTTASTTAPATSTMALGADNQVNAQTARTSLSNSQTNLDKLSSLGAATVVCVVDLDTLAESDATLKDDISKYRSNNAQIKPALEGNSAVMDVIKAQHPDFDINHVVGTDIGPSGELVLYVSRS
jgi:hypothetical protein